MSKRQMTTRIPVNQKIRAVSGRRVGQLMGKLSGYLASWRRGARAAAVLALGTVAALGGCGEEKVVRYRITINLDVNGETKSGSGVIQTLFYGGGGVNQPNKYYTQTQGVAAVVDLGRHGWLVAAMRGENTDDEARRRRKESGLTCKQPKQAEGLLDAFKLDAAEVVKLRAGKRELLEGNLPSFVWFPRDNSYTAALQLCPAEFSPMIGADVSLTSATIEIVPDAPLTTVLDIDAPWLTEMRAQKMGGTTGIFKPGRMAYENPGVAKP
jgi:hypothetical protein